MEYFRDRFIEELNDEGPIRIRAFEWPSAEVLQTMSDSDYEAHFVDWIGEAKQEAKERAREFLQSFGCLDRFNRFHTQAQNQSVIPFIGAGMSRPSGFPLWGDFLKGLTSDFPNIQDKVEKHLNAADFEAAAQCLIDCMGDNVFSEEIQNCFGSRHRKIYGPVQLLPLLFGRGCITTNFDYILDRVYEDAGMRFQAEFSGTQLQESIRRSADKPHCIVRLHGEAESGHGRVLTKEEYDTCYSNSEVYRQLLANIISNSSLLFLGCSLEADRTLLALKQIKQNAVVETPRHFAFLPLYENTNREERRRDLSEADIHPIWYPPEDHSQAIEDLFLSLLEGGFHE